MILFHKTRLSAIIILHGKDKNGEAGKIGYKINFYRYFYEYQLPRELEVVEAEIKTLEKEIMDMLRDATE